MAGQYSRSFITLKQERGDYSFNGREAMGSAIIENWGLNGKISITIQNIKPKVFYKVYLIYSNEGNVLGVNAGSLKVDERGKGQLKYEFNAANVADSGIPGEEFNVVAVIVPKENELIVPLAGYRQDSVMWKNNFVEYKPGMKTAPPAEAAVPQPEREASPAKAVETREKYKEEAPAETTNAEGIKEEASAEETSAEDMQEEAPVKAESTGGIQEEESAEVVSTGEMREEALVEAVSAREVSEEMPVEAVNAGEMPEETPVEAVSPKEMPEEAPAEVASAVEMQGEAPLEAASTEKMPEKSPVEASTQEPIAEEKDIHSEFKAMAQKFKKELKELEYYTFLTEEELEKYRKKYEKADEVANQAYKAETEPENEIERMFRQHTGMTPFKRQNRNVHWIRISPRELVLLPFDFYSLLCNPFVLCAYRKYHHLLLGRINDQWGRQYILGVPEQYLAENRLAASKMGFGQFKCCEDTKPRDGDYGYWLMGVQ